MKNYKKNGVNLSGVTVNEDKRIESRFRKEMATRGKRYYKRHKIENALLDGMLIIIGLALAFGALSALK